MTSDADAIERPAARPSYAARAFLLQYNLILLGGSALFSLALASPVPLVVGVSAELVWLLVGSNLGGVRGFLDRRAGSFEEEEAVTSPLASESGTAFAREYQQRIEILKRALAEIRSFAGPRADPAFRSSTAKLETIKSAFVATCEAHQGIARFLLATPEEELAAEVERVQLALSAEKDLGVKMAQRQALLLAKRRVEQRASMLSELGGLSFQLETIERALAYLVNTGRAVGGTQKLADEIDALVAEVAPVHGAGVAGATARA